MKRRPHVRMKPGWVDPFGVHPASGGHRLILTLPDLPDHTVRQCHSFLRELLYVVEEQYQHQLARAYGWAPAPYAEDQEQSDEEDEDDF